jgi:hypothetical protein
MSRNKVQFQKGLSESAFDAAYGSEEQCHAALGVGPRVLNVPIAAAKRIAS